MIKPNEIACPKCGNQPSSEDRWYCTCGQRWNTFTTLGKCPGCGEQWENTQCPKCNGWSPHADWHRWITQLLKKELKGLHINLRRRK